MAGAAIVTFGAPEAAEAAMKLDRSIIAGNSRFIAPWIYMRSRDFLRGSAGVLRDFETVLNVLNVGWFLSLYTGHGSIRDGKVNS